MRVARQGISPTKRLDWIEIRARYALEGKPWSPNIRDTPRDSVKKMERDFAKCREELAALQAAQSATAAHLPIRRDLIERQRKVIQEYFDGDGLFDDLDLTDIKTVLDWVLAAPDNGAKK
jgi:hypothetical protein